MNVILTVGLWQAVCLGLGGGEFSCRGICYVDDDDVNGRNGGSRMYAER